MENKKLEDQIKQAIYVGVGASTIMLEKTKEFIDKCIEKGKETCETHQVSNEELKHTVEEQVKKFVDVTIVKDLSTDEFIEKMNDLNEDEITKIKEKLAEIDVKNQDEK